MFINHKTRTVHFILLIRPSTHFLFYKNVKSQLWEYLKNMFIALRVFSSTFNAFLRTNALFWHGRDLKKLRTLEPQIKLLVLIKKKVCTSQDGFLPGGANAMHFLGLLAICIHSPINT